MFTDFKERQQIELAKLKEMNWPNRISHIWEYYKGTIIVTIVLIASVITLIQAQIEANKDMIISGAFINTSTTEDGYTFLSDDYWAFKGSSDNQRIQIGATFSLTDENGNFTSESAQYVSQIDTFIAGQVHDYFITDIHAMNFLDDREYLLDLTTVLSPEQLEAWKDRLVYNRNNLCIAVKLDNTKLSEQYGLLYTSYFSGICNGTNIAEIPAFLEYIIGSNIE